MFKRFKIQRALFALDFRGEASNVLNHPVFFVGDQNINSRALDRARARFPFPRVLQLSLKLTF